MPKHKKVQESNESGPQTPKRKKAQESNESGPQTPKRKKVQESNESNVRYCVLYSLSFVCIDLLHTTVTSTTKYIHLLLQLPVPVASSEQQHCSHLISEMVC